jgi:vacuolar protein sorting-associated protein 13A/C
MMLRGAMSHQEYLVIIECASTNVSELPNLPPTFREPVEFSEICNEERMLLELPGESKEETSAIMSDLEASSAAPSWTRVRATVDVQHVELKIFTGVDFESALACIEVRTPTSSILCVPNCPESILH